MNILHELFEMGLEYYHLRKPHEDYEQHCNYLEEIDSKYHAKIVVHYFHELMNDFDLKGIHYREQQRKDANENELQKYINKKNVSVSSSFHSIEDIEACRVNFNYHFLSPVFSSISKQGYQGKEFIVNHISKQVIGVGGVTVGNLEIIDSMGYSGVGVLGGIWNNSTPIENFKTMLDFYKN